MRLSEKTCTIYHGMKNGEEYLSNHDHSDYDIYGGFYGDCSLLGVINNVKCIITLGDKHSVYDSSEDVYVKVEDECGEIYLSLVNILKNNLINKIIR